MPSLFDYGAGILGGIATGGALGIGPLAGAILGGAGVKNKAIGQGVGIAKAGVGAADAIGKDNSESPLTQDPFGSGKSAIDRAVEQRQSSPDSLINTSLAALKDPSLGLDGDAVTTIATPFLEAKHFKGPREFA